MPEIKICALRYMTEIHDVLVRWRPGEPFQLLGSATPDEVMDPQLRWRWLWSALLIQDLGEPVHHRVG